MFSLLVQLLRQMDSSPSPLDLPTLPVLMATRLLQSVLIQICQHSTTAGWMVIKTHCVTKPGANSTAIVSFLARWTSSLVMDQWWSKTPWSLSEGQTLANSTRWRLMAGKRGDNLEELSFITAGLSLSRNLSPWGSTSRHTWVGHGRHSLGLLWWKHN